MHREMVDYDAARDEALAAHDLLILRFSNEQVMTTRDSVLSQIAATCAARLAP